MNAPPDNPIIESLDLTCSHLKEMLTNASTYAAPDGGRIVHFSNFAEFRQFWKVQRDSARDHTEQLKTLLAHAIAHAKAAKWELEIPLMEWLDLEDGPGFDVALVGPKPRCEDPAAYECYQKQALVDQWQAMLTQIGNCLRLLQVSNAVIPQTSERIFNGKIPDNAELVLLCVKVQADPHGRDSMRDHANMIAKGKRSKKESLATQFSRLDEVGRLNF